MLTAASRIRKGSGALVKRIADHWLQHPGMRQGNDLGTQYRSAISWDTDEHRQLAEASRDAFNEQLKAKV